MLTAAPYTVRRRCIIAATAVVVLFVIAAALLRAGSGRDAFGTADQVAVAVLGVAIASGIMVPARSRLRVDDAGLWIRNAFGTHQVPWDLVEAIRFERRSPWATLEFADGDVLGIMALRANDGQRTVEALQALRAQLAARHGGDT